MKKERVLDFAAFHSRVREEGGLWRSLEELSGDEGFQRLLEAEFPYMQDDGEGERVDRRSFLKFMGASVAFAGLAACRPPAEAIIPYVKMPEAIVPGKPLFFATAMPHHAGALGLLVETHEGRPTKIEGNPTHPASLGATHLFAQASILEMYDPDRSQTVRHLGNATAWSEFVAAVGAETAKHRSSGAGLRILTEPTVSPSMADQIQRVLAKYPGAQWHQWTADNADAAFEGSAAAFGRPMQPVYDFSQADVVLTLDANILSDNAAGVRYARDFAARRKLTEGNATMNRLYAIESMPQSTGAMADHRLIAKPSEVEQIARVFAASLGRGQAPDGLRPGVQQWISAVVRDLQAHAGRSLVVAGESQTPAVHAAAHAINAALGNVGRTVRYTETPAISPVNNTGSIARLVADMNAGRVQSLFIIGGNPVFDAPADLQFAEALKKVPFRANTGIYYDETAALCHWHVNAAHFLESWGDARSFDGTVSIIQPMIAPLYNGRSALEFLAAVEGEASRSGYQIVREYWQQRGLAADEAWRKALHEGVVPNTQFTPASAAAGAVPPPSQNAVPAGIELLLRPDPTIGDGRWANNGWLQELPKPITKLTWDNALHVSPAMARRMNLRNEQVVEVRANGASVQAPVWVTPGHPDEAVTLHYGYGRTRGGRVADKVGVNVYPLRTTGALSIVPGAEIVPTGERYKLAPTQENHALDSASLLEHLDERHRDLVRHATLAEYNANPKFARTAADDDNEMHLLHGWEYKGAAWGMAIDLNACLGCGGCVVACNAENNIPVIGKKEVRRGREMQWLRIDRYYSGSPDNPDTFHIPILCMHCENAPCEPVCPVEATTHSPEGINEMTYNRCVGTRYCANNCPYKVRRFNYFNYADFETPSYKLMRNPDVTTRSRGVMEKCTYCVQRVNAARIEAEKEARRVRDGEIVTACEAACPTRAITFGDINDPESRVAKLRANPRNYKLLGEINTQPRTTFLALVRNPNPEIEAIQ